MRARLEIAQPRLSAAEIELRVINLISEREGAIRAEIKRAAALPLPVNCQCLASMARRHGLSTDLVPSDPTLPNCPCVAHLIEREGQGS